jgi:hypothetical protein
MIFEIDKDSKMLVAHRACWNPGELELEKYLVSTTQEDIATLNTSVFGESLLLVNNQVRTRTGKRADILALDRMGNSVIIELKRNNSPLGVETQALQYLADFSRFKGEHFLSRFSKDNPELEDNIRGFLGDEIRLEDINKNSRIISLARSFDSTLFSMGEWLSSRGVAFRCIEYTPVEYENKRLLSFSVVFDRSPESLFPLSFESSIRQPGYFWHNIGQSSDQWWGYLIKSSQIATCFDCQPGDQGEKILKRYIKDDIIIAYARKYGAVGWGVIKNPNSYKLLQVGCKEDILEGEYLHRLNIDWKYTLSKIEDAVKPADLIEKYGIFHPRSTSVRIDPKKAKKMIANMQK